MQVEEIWLTNLAVAKRHLVERVPAGKDSVRRLFGQVARQADETTRRQVGTSAWATYTNDRARWVEQPAPYVSAATGGHYYDGPLGISPRSTRRRSGPDEVERRRRATEARLFSSSEMKLAAG